MKKNDNFLKHVAIYGLGSVLLQGANALLLPLYTYYLAPGDFGVLEIVNRTGEIFQIVLMANGIRLAGLTFYKQSKPGVAKDQVAATATILILLLLFAGALFAYLFRGSIASLISLDDPNLLFLGMVSVLLQATTTVPLALIQARVESLQFILTSLAMLFVRVSLLLIALVWIDLGVWGVFGATALTGGLFGAVLTFRELVRSSFRPDFSKIMPFSRFVLPLVPTGFCFFVLQNGDRFFLIRYSSEAEVGVYALAYRLAIALGAFSLVAFRRVWTARMFDNYAAPDGSLAVGRAIRGQLSVYLFAAVGLCLLDNQVLSLLAPVEYANAAPLIKPLCLALFFWNASNFTEGSLYAFHRTALKPILALASTVVILFLYAVMIPSLGAMGAALSTLIGFIFHATITYFVTQRIFVVKYGLSRMGGLLLLAILAVAIGETLGNNFLGVVGKLAIWIICPAAAWFIGLLTYHDKQWIQEQYKVGIAYTKLHQRRIFLK